MRCGCWIPSTISTSSFSNSNLKILCVYIYVCVLRMTLLKGLPNRWIMVDYNHLSGIVIQAMLDPFIVDPRAAA